MLTSSFNSRSTKEGDTGEARGGGLGGGGGGGGGGKALVPTFNI